ncbi:19999_t:CDS:2, partial [Racocetra fulgida]
TVHPVKTDNSSKLIENLENQSTMSVFEYKKAKEDWVTGHDVKLTNDDNEKKKKRWESDSDDDLIELSVNEEKSDDKDLADEETFFERI